MHTDAVSSCGSVGLSSQENCPSQLPAPHSTRDFYDLLFAFFPPKLTSWEGPAEELRERRGSQNEALLPEQRHSVLCANKLMKLCFSSTVSMSVTSKIGHLFFKGKLKCLSISRSRIQKTFQAVSSFNTEWDCAGSLFRHLSVSQGVFPGENWCCLTLRDSINKYPDIY